MSAILLIFVVSFALVSGDVAGDQHLLERIEMLEQKLYEMMLEVRHVKNDCNCSYLEEDIRDIGIIAAKNRHNILVNSDMIKKNEDTIEVNTGMIIKNEDTIEVNANSIIDMEEKVESNTGNLEVRIL